MTSYMPGFAPQQPGIGGMPAGLSSGMAQLIRSMMMQRPDLAQILASMSQQKAGGLGQLAGQPPANFGPQPLPYGGWSDLLYRPGRDGPMPGQNRSGPPQYSGPMPQGGMWGRPTQPMAPQGGNGYNMGAGGVRPGLGLGMPPGMAGNRGTGPTLPYNQRFDMTPDAPAMAMMPTSYDGGRTYQMQGGQVGRPAAPYRPPAYSPQPMPQTPPSPGAFSSQPPGAGMAGNGGTVGLDWYAQQAGA